MTFKRLLGVAMALCAVAVLTGSVGAGAARTPAKRAIDLSTNTSVRDYLRSHGISPRGVAIQRGVRNYAGPSCPGKGWACTHAMRVVQIATGRGRNMFRCLKAKRCLVVQLTKSALAASTATCVKTTGITQSCSITQNGTGPNEARVYMSAGKSSGLTQNATQTATITQTASGGGTNKACVSQIADIQSTTTAKRGVPVSVTLDAHQSISVSQNSQSGSNTLADATNTGGCGSSPLKQSQLIVSKANGAMNITQNENTLGSTANMFVDVAQNSTSGANTANFDQTNTLVAIAIGPGPVNQTQSTVDGGIDARVNQFSHGLSLTTVNQTETQCVHAQTSGSYACPGTGTFTLPASLHQTQHGPVRKGTCCSTQADNDDNEFHILQTSKQDSDDGSVDQTNTVEADCSTSGNCTATQETRVDGQTTTNTQSGSSVNTSITCSDESGCTKTVPPTPTITSHPPDPSSSSSATFTFTDTEPVTFLCQIDNSGYANCASPKTYTGLTNGSHTFSVKANDANGNESDPATYPWTIDTSSFTDNGSQLTALNVDVKEFGFGGMRGSGTGSISVTGVTATVRKALLYWNGPTNSTDPNANAAVTFDGHAVNGSNIGTASSNCWEGAGFMNSQSYRADVTSYVTGNGTYALADFVKPGGIDINGVALVVFYDNGSTADDRNVVLWSGNDSNVLAFDPDTSTWPVDGWDETLTGVQYPGSGTATLDFVVSDGQTFTDDALVLNGSELVAAGGIFQGDSTPAGSFDASGKLWDVKSFNITSFLTAGSNNLHLTSGEVADCLSLVVAAANTPASAPVILSPAIGASHHSAATQIAPTSTANRSGGSGGSTSRP